ncbi:Putative peptidoglycan binding domain-containing protein [Streptomyces sp. TLI_053]|uniref:peptidoglycan-binding domain-containing protein n=1 Tax=Streptomyces sp. TLI_053 TaxID=1855352 RepID=UPI00087D47EB|nr:peptidoglycan-binding domain-containing protein [Streptomyces sp. TLI_053]SDT83363.1 Putative peptidoglycan binding domain-containing protein [Streptomyces sp. TLI_053]
MRIGRRIAVRGSILTAVAGLLIGLCAPAATANPNARNIRYGDSGTAVRCVQLALNMYFEETRRYGHSLEVDSVFGANTLKEVKYFQDLNGLDADGVVGPRTGNYLDNEISDGVLFGFCRSYIPTLR